MDEPEGPYWQGHYGMGRRWTPSTAGRKGCLTALYGGFIVLVLVLLVTFVATILAR